MDGRPFKTFEEAVGLPQGLLTGIENIGATNGPTMAKNGFPQKRIGKDWATGDWYSAYRNPGTNEWAGGKTSGYIP